MSDSNPPPMADPTGENEERPRRLLVRTVGLLMVIVSVVAATYLVVAYFAWESGRAQQAEIVRTQTSEAIQQQVTMARDDLAGGSFDVAMRRLDWVLGQQPDHPDALALRAQVDSARTEAAAATAAAATAVAQPATSEPDADEGPDEAEALTLLQELRRQMAREAYEEALPAIVSFQQQFPSFERLETDQMLYDSYLALGLAAMQTDKVELGLNYLSQAENLGDLPQEALDYRYWAELYLDGASYYGVNWEIASFYFRDLCAAAPFFQDACQQLNQILVNWGDQYFFAGDYCPAESIYREVPSPNPALADKLRQARENCLLATPVPLTGTVPITGATGLTNTVPITETGPGG